MGRDGIVDGETAALDTVSAKLLAYLRETNTPALTAHHYNKLYYTGFTINACTNTYRDIIYNASFSGQ